MVYPEGVQWVLLILACMCTETVFDRVICDGQKKVATRMQCGMIAVTVEAHREYIRKMTRVFVKHRLQGNIGDRQYERLLQDVKQDVPQLFGPTLAVLPVPMCRILSKASHHGNV